jgi:uncharacterized membrane protein
MSPVAGLERREAERAGQSLLLTGVLLGVGLVGSLDQIVLHELLQWHNLYIHTTTYWRIFIDGLFHTASVGLLLVAALRLWRGRRPLARTGSWRTLTAGVLVGMGGFNLYDGIVQHKLLQLHPVREGVANQLPYDLAFNSIAILLLAAGLSTWRKSARKTDQPADETASAAQPGRPG